MISRNMIKFLCSNTAPRNMDLLRKLQLVQQQSSDLVGREKMLAKEVTKMNKIDTRKIKIN